MKAFWFRRNRQRGSVVCRKRRAVWAVLGAGLVLPWLGAPRGNLPAAEIDPRVAEVETRAIQYRESIRSGELSLISRITKLTDGAPGSVKVTRVHCWFDGANRRHDYLRQPNSQRVAGEYRECFSQLGNTIRHYTNIRLADGGRPTSSIYYVGKLNYETLNFFDPRLIGMWSVANYSMLVHFQMNSLVSVRQKMEQVEMRDELIDGQRCAHVSCTGLNGGLKVWYALDRNCNPVRIEVWQDNVFDTLEVTLANVENVGWFPSRTEFTRLSNGRLTLSEQLEIQVHSLNEPFGDDVYTFAGMGTPPGSRIADYRGEGYLTTWEMPEDGVEPEPGLPRAIPEPNREKAAPAGPWRGTLLLVNAALFAAVAGWLIWRRWRAAQGGRNGR